MSACVICSRFPSGLYHNQQEEKSINVYTECRIKVGAIIATALGPCVKQKFFLLNSGKKIGPFLGSSIRPNLDLLYAKSTIDFKANIYV